MLSVESSASCGASFPVDRETVRSPSFFLSRFSRGRAVSPAARASHGNVMQIMTGTRWARTGNASASRRARAAEAAPGKAARVEPAARRDGFQDYYAVKSHLAAVRAPRGGVREHVRSEVKSRGVMREGRACRGRTHAAHAPPPHTRWPWYMRPPTLVGARVPRARPAPRTRSDCRTSRAGGGPPGTSAPTTGPSHVPAPATFPPQPRPRPSHVPAVVLAAEPCAPSRNRAENAPFARVGSCAENVQGAFRRGRKCFSPRVSWGRAGNRNRPSRKNRDTGC